MNWPSPPAKSPLESASASTRPPSSLSPSFSLERLDDLGDAVDELQRLRDDAAGRRAPPAATRTPSTPTPTRASDQRSRMPKRCVSQSAGARSRMASKNADEGQKDYVDRIPEEHQHDHRRDGDADVHQRVLGGVLALGLVHGFYGPGRTGVSSCYFTLTGLPVVADFLRRLAQQQHAAAVFGRHFGRLAPLDAVDEGRQLGGVGGRVARLEVRPRVVAAGRIGARALDAWWA